MRRLWVTAAGCAVLLLGSACSADPAPTDSAARPGAPASAGAAGTGPAASGDAATESPGSAAKPPAPRTVASAGQGPRARAVEEAALTGNTIAICDQATKISGTAATTFATDLKMIIEASATGDKAKVARAEEKARGDVQNWSFALGSMSKLVADPAVKKALADMSRSVAKLKGKVADVDPTKLDGLRSKLDEACGRS